MSVDSSPFIIEPFTMQESLSFLGKERGPKAGALLSYLERDFVIDRIRNVAGFLEKMPEISR
ncbi:MAG: hypothetical protein ACKO7A_24840 [Microcystis sp.]